MKLFLVAAIALSKALVSFAAAQSPVVSPDGKFCVHVQRSEDNARDATLSILPRNGTARLWERSSDEAGWFGPDDRIVWRSDSQFVAIEFSGPQATAWVEVVGLVEDRFVDFEFQTPAPPFVRERYTTRGGYTFESWDEGGGLWVSDSASNASYRFAREGWVLVADKAEDHPDPAIVSKDPPKPTRPNIVLIMTDDQGWGDLGCHGNDIVQTPNIDRMAAEGARFDRFYVSPVCAPTRASLLTGRYHLRTNVHGVTRGEENMRADEVTFAEVLRGAGYATGCFGKWHNGAHFPHHPNGQGFDQFVGFCAGHWNNYFDGHLEENGEPVEFGGYITDYLTDRALGWIEDQAKADKPFLCYLPYNAPHSPWQVPDEWWAKYQGKGLNPEVACAYAMCENIDFNVGRILAKLAALGIDRQTAVIFLTDNGPNTERYNGGMKGRKGSVDEGGVRVPLVVRWPGAIPAGRTIMPIASHIDILPTLAELCGAAIPAEAKPRDGVSLAPLLTGKGDAGWPERMIFSAWRNKASVRTQRYRADQKALYDMQNDPGQKKDIAKQMPELHARLAKAIAAWEREVTPQPLAPLPVPVGFPGRDLVVLPGHEALLQPGIGKGIRYEGASGWANDWVSGWTDAKAFPLWELDVARAGRYQVALDFACDPANAGAEVFAEAAGAMTSAKAVPGFVSKEIPLPDRVGRKEVGERPWARLALGELELPAGRCQLAIKTAAIPGGEAGDFKAVRLRRIE